MKTKLLIILSFAIAVNGHAGSAAWNLNPTSGDWNTATNWTPATVPDGPADVATFAVSEVKEVFISSGTEVSALVFEPGASAYIITSTLADPLTISGPGVANNSGVIQTFVLDQQEQTPEGSALTFSNTATAGSDTAFTVMGGEDFLYGSGGRISFLGDSSADQATFDIFGSQPNAFSAGEVYFYDNSSAANGTFILHSPVSGNSNPALLAFSGTSCTAGQATITNTGGFLDFVNSATAGSSTIINNRFASFLNTSSAGQATIVNNAGSFSSAPFVGELSIWTAATAADSTIINRGATASGLVGGITFFSSGSPTAGNATLIAESGKNGGLGGLIQFDQGTDGGMSRVEIFGNGQLDISGHDAPGVTIGSLEGDGLLFLGGNNLSIGSDSLSTTFAGIAQDGGTDGGVGGALTKIGSGTLTLSDSNTYSGKTTVTEGALLASNLDGSATGAGTVIVRGGTLGGSGTIAGSVRVGTGSGAGAFLVPAFGSNKQVTLTLQSSLTLQADATYTYTFKARKNQSRTDQVITNGVTITGATINLQGATQGRLKRGVVLTVISNTSANPISGAFINLADGSIVTVNGNNLQASYTGGDGNDLTLTVVP